VVPELDEARSDEILTAPFPLYGLSADWGGPRYLVGFQRSDGRLTGVILSHGDPRRPSAPQADGPWLEVETMDLAVPDISWSGGLLLRAIAERLLEHALTPPEGMGKERALRLAEEIQRQIPDPDSPRWRPLDVDIDRRPHRFQSLEQGEHWAAGGQVGAVLLLVAGYRFPMAEVRLARLPDLRRYRSEIQ
jgi:hypothetical protein